MAIKPSEVMELRILEEKAKAIKYEEIIDAYLTQHFTGGQLCFDLVNMNDLTLEWGNPTETLKRRLAAVYANAGWDVCVTDDVLTFTAPPNSVNFHYGQ